MEGSEFLRRPDPKASARGIDERADAALKALEIANKGKDAERTGVSARTLFRMYPNCGLYIRKFQALEEVTQMDVLPEAKSLAQTVLDTREQAKEGTHDASEHLIFLENIEARTNNT